MKVVLALLACVAVSHAAFTGTLQQRTKPLVDQAMFKLQLANGRSDIGSMIMGMLQPHIQSVMDGIQGHVDTAQAAAQALYNQIQDMASMLGANVQGMISQLPPALQNMFSGLAGNSGKMDISSVMSTVETHIANVQTTIQTLMEQAQLMASQLTIPNLMQWLAGQMGLQGRGFFSDIWGSITGAVGNAWDTASNHVSNAWDSATTQALAAWNEMYGTASAVAGTTMDSVSSLASAFIADAQAGANHMSNQAAEQFQAMMSQWSDQLGDQWGQIQTEVAQIVAGNNNAINVGKKF